MLQNDQGGGGNGAAVVGGIGGTIFVLVYLAIMAIWLIGMWKVFVKAGEPGWAVLVPIYNIIVLLKIVGRPVWWILILWLVIPFFLIGFDLARKFGKGGGFGIGLTLLPFIFYPLLGFGDARYNPAA
jgi:hypothetical protein